MGHLINHKWCVDLYFCTCTDEYINEYIVHLKYLILLVRFGPKKKVLKIIAI